MPLSRRLRVAVFSVERNIGIGNPTARRLVAGDPSIEERCSEWAQCDRVRTYKIK